MANRAAIPVLVSLMLLTGVCNTLLTKYQDMQCVADCHTKHPKLFEQPVLQTLQMFIGEAGCWLVVLSAIVFQRIRAKLVARRDGAYQAIAANEESGLDIDDNVESDDEIQGMSTSQTLVDPSNIQAKSLIDGEQSGKVREPLTGIKILLLACPAICDILGTTLMNVGLLFVAASIYQMLRGTLILFVGLFSVLFLKHHLGGLKWASLFIVVLGVAIVGLAGALGSKTELHEGGNSLDAIRSAALVLRSDITAEEIHTAGQTILGLFLIAAAQIFTATQFVLEESIMEHYSMDPIQVVGWEGVFGFLVTLVGMGILHLAIGQTAHGRGGYFDAREGFHELFHNRAIGISSILIMISIGGFNFFGLSVTRSVSATSRSTIDTCRTLFIWIVSLGLGWETFKWLQVLGFVLLVYGTFLFNEIVRAPTLAFLRRRGRGPIALEDDDED